MSARPTDDGRDTAPKDRFARALRLRCVTCGRGAMFKGLASMRDRCEHCGYKFAREAGYWLGAMYVNYGVAVALAISAHLIMSDVYDVPTLWQAVSLVPLSALFVIWFFRYSRALWLAIDLIFDPPKAADFDDREDPEGP